MTRIPRDQPPAIGNSLQLVMAKVADAATSPKAPTMPATPAPHSAPTLGKVLPAALIGLTTSTQQKTLKKTTAMDWNHLKPNVHIMTPCQNIRVEKRCCSIIIQVTRRDCAGEPCSCRTHHFCQGFCVHGAGKGGNVVAGLWASFYLNTSECHTGKHGEAMSKWFSVLDMASAMKRKHRLWEDTLIHALISFQDNNGQAQRIWHVITSRWVIPTMTYDAHSDASFWQGREEGGKG